MWDKDFQRNGWSQSVSLDLNKQKRRLSAVILRVPDRDFLSRFPNQVFVARMVEMRETDIKILLKTKIHLKSSVHWGVERKAGDNSH